MTIGMGDAHDGQYDYIETDIEYASLAWAALVASITENRVEHQLRWATGSKTVTSETL